MDIGVIIALCVASFLTLISGVAAGLFGGMWWQARQTAQVWEKAYTHVREQLPAIRHDTYNTGREPLAPPPRERATGGPIEGGKHGLVGEQPPEQGVIKERVTVQAETRSPPVVPSKGAQSFGVELEDDPFAPQVRR